MVMWTTAGLWTDSRNAPLMHPALTGDSASVSPEVSLPERISPSDSCHHSHLESLSRVGRGWGPLGMGNGGKLKLGFK